MDYTLNCNGRLLSLKEPQVMGIMRARAAAAKAAAEAAKAAAEAAKPKSE